MNSDPKQQPTIAELLDRIEELEARAQSRRRIARLVPGRRALTVLVSGGLALAMAASAFASIPASGGVIHGCYTNAMVNGQAALTLLDTASGKVCTSLQTAVSWNQ